MSFQHIMKTLICLCGFILISASVLSQTQATKIQKTKINLKPLSCDKKLIYETDDIRMNFCLKESMKVLNETHKKHDVDEDAQLLKWLAEKSKTQPKVIVHYSMSSVNQMLDKASKKYPDDFLKKDEEFQKSFQNKFGMSFKVLERFQYLARHMLKDGRAEVFHKKNQSQEQQVILVESSQKGVMGVEIFTTLDKTLILQVMLWVS